MFQCNIENVGVAWGQGYPLYSYHSYLGPTIYRGKSSEIRPPSIMAKAVFPIVAAIEGFHCIDVSKNVLKGIHKWDSVRS